MARLDIRKLKSKGRVQLVVEIQSDMVDDLPTAIVAPLIEPGELAPYKDINPIFKIRNKTMALRVEQLVGIPRKLLGDKVGSLIEEEYQVSRALDRLLFRS